MRIPFLLRSSAVMVGLMLSGATLNVRAAASASREAGPVSGTMLSPMMPSFPAPETGLLPLDWPRTQTKTLPTRWPPSTIHLAADAGKAPSAAAPATHSSSDMAETFWNACLKGTPQQVKALIDAGADVNAVPQKSVGGMTPLMVAAASNRNLDIVNMLLKAGANVNARDDQGRTVLMVNVWAGQQADITAALLKAGADVRARDDYGRTALMLAAGNDPDPAIVGTLIEAGAKINATSKDGRTALMFAAEGNHDPAMIATLVKAGANVNAATPTGRTALMFAANNSEVPVIEALLKAGADIHAKDKVGNTSLIWMAVIDYMYASKRKAMVAAGANATVQNDQGQTADQIAKMSLDARSDLIQAWMKKT